MLGRAERVLSSSSPGCSIRSLSSFSKPGGRVPVKDTPTLNLGLWSHRAAEVLRKELLVHCPGQADSGSSERTLRSSAWACGHDGRQWFFGKNSPFTARAKLTVVLRKELPVHRPGQADSGSSERTLRSSAWALVHPDRDSS
ncbi:hypothetical protein LR48_Vigan04g106400 [Vigna angularis]|uniref:Uncharacterized protein n=1 Tax=Phaseolus angularis TaxID=3914 RepID=A0A0L9UDS6_PHAAN|nr:hypothetical protein LR48_Vigan04g106400 [Vigna angularis]